MIFKALRKQALNIQGQRVKVLVDYWSPFIQRAIENNALNGILTTKFSVYSWFFHAIDPRDFQSFVAKLKEDKYFDGFKIIITSLAKQELKFQL